MNATKIPDNAKIKAYTQGAYFFDTHCREITDKKQSALEVYLTMMKNTPSWIDSMMSLRNQVVSRIGLKDLGKISNLQTHKPMGEYQVGERVGIFSIYAMSDNEIILQDNDKHLDVKLSIYLDETDSNTDSHADKTVNVTVTTVVHTDNLMGKGYMLFVEPMHKLIVPATLKSLI